MKFFILNDEGTRKLYAVVPKDITAMGSDFRPFLGWTASHVGDAVAAYLNELGGSAIDFEGTTPSFAATEVDSASAIREYAAANKGTIAEVVSGYRRLLDTYVPMVSDVTDSEGAAATNVTYVSTGTRESVYAGAANADFAKGVIINPAEVGLFDVSDIVAAPVVQNNILNVDSAGTESKLSLAVRINAGAGNAVGSMDYDVDSLDGIKASVTFVVTETIPIKMDDNAQLALVDITLTPDVIAYR